jgi:integrase
MTVAHRAMQIWPARPVHAGQHYFWMALCRARRSVRIVQKLLGHANLSTTMRHVHAVGKDIETAMVTCKP